MAVSYSQVLNQIMWDIKSSIKIGVICKKYSNYPRAFIMVKYNILYQKSFKLTYWLVPKDTIQGSHDLAAI
jgi:hypothetical protein